MFDIILWMALSLWYYHISFPGVKVLFKFILRKWQGQFIIWGLLGQILYFLIVFYPFLVSAHHTSAWFGSCPPKCPRENWNAGSAGSHIWALILDLPAVNWQVVGKLLNGFKILFPEPYNGNKNITSEYQWDNVTKGYTVMPGTPPNRCSDVQ